MTPTVVTYRVTSQGVFVGKSTWAPKEVFLRSMEEFYGEDAVTDRGEFIDVVVSDPQPDCGCGG